MSKEGPVSILCARNCSSLFNTRECDIPSPFGDKRDCSSILINFRSYMPKEERMRTQPIELHGTLSDIGKALIALGVINPGEL